MEETVALVAVLLCILIAAAISRRIQGTIITLPMIYTLLGLILSGRALGIIDLDLDSDLIRIIAEVEVQGLMMLTFMIVFGLVMLPPALDEFNGLMLLYAVLSLALLRLLAVGASVIRTKDKLVTR